MKLKFYKRVLVTLLLLVSLSGCRHCREWIYQDVYTFDARYRSGRLVLEPDSEATPFTLEIVRTRSGVRMYVNALLLPVPAYEGNSELAELEIILDDGQVLRVYPYRFAGGERLLLPSDVGSYLMELLIHEQCFTIYMKHKKARIIPDSFKKAYFQLMEIPIA